VNVREREGGRERNREKEGDHSDALFEREENFLLSCAMDKL
jgi:hypothetical protein